eukprot:3386199-Pyramimonas_sp.AAC.1
MQYKSEPTRGHMYGTPHAYVQCQSTCGHKAAELSAQSARKHVSAKRHACPEKPFDLGEPLEGLLSASWDLLGPSW